MQACSLSLHFQNHRSATLVPKPRISGGSTVMESTPVTEIIQILTSIHQAQHQALVDIRIDYIEWCRTLGLKKRWPSWWSLRAVGKSLWLQPFHRSILLVRHLWGCLKVVCKCQLGNPLATPKAQLHPLLLIEIPLVWAIRWDCTGALLCVSPGGLCKKLPRSSNSAQPFCTQCCRGTLSHYFPSWDPKSNPNWSRHKVYVTHISQTVQINGDKIDSFQCLPSADGQTSWAI